MIKHSCGAIPGRAAAPGSRKHFPVWLKRPIPAVGAKKQIVQTIHNRRLHTVCEEAKCPNRGECYGNGTATFLIMGDICSRNCRFCAIRSDRPKPLDPDEPGRIARAAGAMGLRYAVVTSVTRDDLPDGGAAHFAATVSCLKQHIPDIGIEVLIPDFKGNIKALHTVLESGPDVCNHNIETVRRLYPRIRPAARYDRSLSILSEAARCAPRVPVKSGLMVGLGETEDEVLSLMNDLRAHGCSILTIGQYLRPSPAQVPVTAWVRPGRFERYRREALRRGFAAVQAGPYVRSSYHASRMHEISTTKNRPPRAV